MLENKATTISDQSSHTKTTLKIKITFIFFHQLRPHIEDHQQAADREAEERLRRVWELQREGQEGDVPAEEHVAGRLRHHGGVQPRATAEAPLRKDRRHGSRYGGKNSVVLEIYLSVFI